jgi:hypothetical protein
MYQHHWRPVRPKKRPQKGQLYYPHRSASAAPSECQWFRVKPVGMDQIRCNNIIEVQLGQTKARKRLYKGQLSYPHTTACAAHQFCMLLSKEHSFDSLLTSIYIFLSSKRSIRLRKAKKRPKKAIYFILIKQQVQHINFACFWAENLILTLWI